MRIIETSNRISLGKEQLDEADTERKPIDQLNLTFHLGIVLIKNFRFDVFP